MADIQKAANAPRISSAFLQRARRKGDNFEKRSMARERSEVPSEVRDPQHFSSPTLQSPARDPKFPPERGRAPASISYLRPGGSPKCDMSPLDRRNPSHGEMRRSNGSLGIPLRSKRTFIGDALTLIQIVSDPDLLAASRRLATFPTLKAHSVPSPRDRRNQSK